MQSKKLLHTHTHRVGTLAGAGIERGEVETDIWAAYMIYKIYPDFRCDTGIRKMFRKPILVINFTDAVLNLPEHKI